MDKAIIFTIIALTVSGLAVGVLGAGRCDGLPPNEIYPFPHETNCSLYYECQNGVENLRQCPNDLYYNSNTQSCDFIEPLNCRAATTAVTNGPQGDPRCRGINNDFFPHLTDCTKYIECYQGNSYLMSCPNGYHFSEKRKLCVHPDVAGCQAATTNPTTATTETTRTTPPTTIPTSPPTTKPSTPATPPPTTPTTVPPTTATTKPPTTATTIPPTTPTTIPPTTPTTIPPTTPPSTKPPTVTTLTPPTTPHPLCWGVRPGEIILKPAEDDCAAYWRCEGAVLTSQRCPQYFYFNAALQLCDFADTVQCNAITSSPTIPTTPGPSPSTPTVPDTRCRDKPESFWPHPTICTKYIECHRGQSYELDCPRGFHFNATLSKCIEERLSQCGKVITTTTSTTKSPDFTKHPDCPADQGHYMFPHPGDCTKYDECAEGIKIVRDCPKDLWFNPIAMICDYPYQAGCKENGLKELLFYYLGIN